MVVQTGDESQTHYSVPIDRDVADKRAPWPGIPYLQSSAILGTSYPVASIRGKERRSNIPTDGRKEQLAGRNVNTNPARGEYLNELV